jgi:ferric-dicitrate binding protein FerR (iron transport regulator)
MDKQLLETYFAGNADRDLKAKIMTWATASEENSRLFIEAKNDWVLRNFPNEPADADDFLRFAEYTEKRTYAIRPTIDTNTIRLSRFNRIYRIAAAIAIPLLFASVFYQIRLSQQLKEHKKNLQTAEFVRILPEQNQTTLDYIVNKGVKGKVLLPDGSEVWLNSHSVLRCPNLFDSVNRIVELEGEGYFKIKSTDDWPFYVHTKKGVSVKVTGTEFNISSYANDPFTKLTLLEGSLMLIDHATQQSISLRPMQELVIRDNRFAQAVSHTAEKVQEDIAWKEGYLVFNNTPIDALIRKMERWYGVTINVQDPQILNYRMTAEFESESLVQVLEILKISSNIRYKVNGTQITLYQ